MDDVGKTNIGFRECEQSDIDDLFEWRNHINVRENSFNMEPISRKEHEEWFKAKLGNPQVAMYMAFLEVETIGVIRFDNEKDTVKVSVMMNPRYVNQGLGSKVIKHGSIKFINEVGNRKSLTAEIKRENIASKKAFQRAGFVEDYSSYVFEIDN